MTPIHFPERLPAGARLDDYYQVTHFLVAGGMADLYAGVQLDTGAPIAIKLLRPTGEQGADPSFEARFAREAQLAAQIDHPNVVQVLAWRSRMELRLPDGRRQAFARPFLVMERLRGHDLADEIHRSGPMAPRRAVRLLLGALDALACGHRQGVVHKDLKPANLFLVEPGHERRERLIVLDFGVARSQEDSLTATGEVATTMLYAAPEYLREQRVTPAIDVYQMGLILMEMLTGAPAVDLGSREMPPRARMAACALMHLHGVQIPPALRQGPLGEVLGRALALEPGQRYPDAEAFCRALEGVCLEELPAPCAPKRRRRLTPATEQARLPPRRPRPRASREVDTEPMRPRRSGTLVLVQSLALVLLACALVGGWWARSLRATEAAQAAPRIAEMVFVAEGPFVQGYGSGQVRATWVESFWMDTHEVTLDDYARCVDAGACMEPRWSAREVQGCNWGVQGRGEHPINCVTWTQAADYCAWMGRRLPSEAEWEKAARGADARLWPWGQDAPDCSRAVMNQGEEGCGLHGTWPVGQRPAGTSPYGAHDMAGNVWEWVAADAQGDPQSRVMRGGGWYSLGSGLMAAQRHQAPSHLADPALGLRCASSAVMTP